MVNKDGYKMLYPYNANHFTMNLQTELVKNKMFNGAIDSALLKHSQEYKVLGILRYLYPEKYDSMVLGEAPDLQDTRKSVGIEVTAAVSQKDMKAARSFAQLCEEKGHKSEKYKKRIEECGFRYTIVNGKYHSIRTFGTANGEKTIFKTAISKKILKSQRYRESFKILGLAVIFTDPPTDEAERNCITWIREAVKEVQKPFDFIYVLSDRFCFCYDISADSYNKRKITSTEWRAISIIARMTAEGDLSLENPEWV